MVIGRERNGAAEAMLQLLVDLIRTFILLSQQINEALTSGIYNDRWRDWTTTGTNATTCTPGIWNIHKMLESARLSR